MNGESCRVDWMISLYDPAVMIYADEVGRFDLAEAHSKTIHPKGIGELRVSSCHMADNSFVKTELRKQSKAGCEPGKQNPQKKAEFLKSTEGDWDVLPFFPLHGAVTRATNYQRNDRVITQYSGPESPSGP